MFFSTPAAAPLPPGTPRCSGSCAPRAAPCTAPPSRAAGCASARCSRATRTCRSRTWGATPPWRSPTRCLRAACARRGTRCGCATRRCRTRVSGGLLVTRALGACACTCACTRLAPASAVCAWPQRHARNNNTRAEPLHPSPPGVEPLPDDDAFLLEDLPSGEVSATDLI